MAVSIPLILMLSAAEPPPGWRVHARFVGIGGCLGQVVAPGPGGERLYATHIYGGDVFDLVAVDPLTGATDVFPCPVPGQIGAWAVAVAPDGQVYVGSLPAAHVLRLDWATRTLVDLGRPAPSEQYLWQLALGADGKLYGCTYPNAKLVRCDPATGELEDLGRMNPTEQYARYVACDDAGFVYVGIGMASRDLVAYEIATGRHASILPGELAGTGSVSLYRGTDGRVYANAGKVLRLNGFEPPVEPPAGEVAPQEPLDLADGRRVRYSGPAIEVVGADGQATSHPTGYRGKSQDLFRVGLGPDDRLYASTAMPIHFFSADPDSDAWEEIAVAGGGEFYSFLAWRDKLLGAAYSAPAPVMIYQPGQPWAPGPGAGDNPRQLHFEGEDAAWRPQTMIHGPGDKVYLGAVSGYGKLGGPLCELDPATGEITAWPHLIPDHSVVSLAALPDGRLVGGTTIGGGGGSHPTATEAKLFVWNPATRQVTFETVPVPGKGAIEALAVGPSGRVHGFAGDRYFVFDPRTETVLKVEPTGFGGVVYSAVGPGPGGELYGVSRQGIVAVDDAAGTVRLLAPYPGGLSAGFAIRGRRIYAASGPTIVSYELPGE